MRYLLGLLVAIFAWTPASAGIYVPPFDMGPTIARQIFDPLIADQKRRGAQPEEGDEVAPAAQQDLASLSFEPSSVRRRANLARFAEKARDADPAGAAAMDQLFASTDVIAAIDAQMRPVGLRADNVADAYALWWMIAWHASNGSDSTPNRETARAVQRQASAALLATPEFASASEASKQEMAEAFMVQAALIDEMNTQAQGKPAQARALATAVKEGARKSGVDLSAMILTPQGFRPRESGNATDGAPAPALDHGAAAGQLADTGRSDSPDHVVLIAAGGLGLGAAFLLGRVLGRRT